MSSDDRERDAGQEAGESTEKPKLSLEVNVQSPGACERHVTVTVSREDIDRYLGEAFDELAPKAEVPGFRPGRAPRKLVESRFKEQVSDQVKGSLLMDSLEQVSEEYEFSAISEPDFDFDAVSIPDDGPLTFEFDVEVRPDFEMPQWKGLALQRPVRQFTNEEIEEQLQALLERRGKIVHRDGPVEAGDLVDVDIRVKQDGRELNQIEDLRVKTLPVLSARDATIDKFDELLVGARKGETRSTTATISEGAENEAMRGKQVDVGVTVKQVSYVQPPALTPSFLEEMGGFEDEDELREAIRGELERQHQYEQQRHLRAQITAELTRDAQWELPPGLVKRQARRELERVRLELQASGFSAEQIQAFANQIRQNSLRSTETALKEHFIFERIAEDEEIDATDVDYDREITSIAAQNDESPRRVRARLEKRGQMDALHNQIIERKVMDLICEHAQFVDQPAEQSESQDTHAADITLAGSRDAAFIPQAKHGGEAEDLHEPIDRS